MTPHHFSLTVSPDGSAHAFVLHRGVFVASRTFAAGELGSLPEWLADSSIWTRDLAMAQSVNPTISYDHHDGMLHLCTSLGSEERFDPNNDESVAKMIRLLKRKAPLVVDVDVRTQPPLPDLPIPTNEQLAAATRYTNIGIPKGVEGYRPHKPKPRYQQSTASKVRSQEIAKSLMSEMFGIE